MRRPVRLVKAKKNKPAQEALDKLNSFLNDTEPVPVYWLTRLWSDQQKAITYKELREAILNGGLDPATVEAWQLDYSNFVEKKLKPAWAASMRAAAGNTAAKYPGFLFDSHSNSVNDWIAEHGAEFVTNITRQQRDAIASMVQYASATGMSPDELAQMIRPTIGLTKPQTKAAANYYQHIKTSLMKNSPTMKEATAAKRAREATMKYTEKLHRQRAYNIATTELAFAYNKGNDEAVKQAIAQGYMGKTRRVWSTALNERVCTVCGALEGTAVDMDDRFEFPSRNGTGYCETPPIHPSCRCALEYQEIEPPKITQPPENDSITTTTGDFALDNLPKRDIMDVEEEAALNNYISSGSYFINEKLRTSLPLTKNDKDFVSFLDSALNKLPAFTGTVYRSIASKTIYDIAEFWAAHKVGETICYPAYTSTSTEVYDETMDIQYIIQSKTGHDLRTYNSEELEVLFGRNTKFKVVKIEGNLIYLEEE